MLSLIQMQLSLKPKTSSDFFNPFLESTSNLKDFEKKKMIVIGTLLRKLKALKDFVRPLSKNAILEHPLRLDMLKDPKLL